MEKLFQLNYTDEGVFLTVLTSMGELLREKVINELKLKQIQQLDILSVDQLMKQPNVEGKIAPPQEEFLLNETATVTTDRNKMTAYINFAPAGGGKLLNAVQIIELLNQSGICYGIDKDVISSLAGNPNKPYDQNITIATGQLPKDGKDSSIQIKFPVLRTKSPKILENGQVDHKNVNRPHTVNNGDVLADLVPATPGTPGKNVLGVELPPKGGKTKPIPAGKFTELSADGLQLIAATDGSVEILDGRITVLRVLEIKGDVGTASGHIDFPGDVFITGNVIRSYNVKAGGSIHVKGCIEASVITAGSDINIYQGVKGLSAQGTSTCVITARGNITSKFIENATVIASGTVRADSILHSNVSSNDKVEAVGKMGNIIGGKISALNSIACYSVGNDTGVSAILTTLEVGVTQETQNQCLAIQEEIDQITKELQNANEILSEFPDESLITAKQEKHRNVIQQQISDLEDRLFPLKRDLKTLQDSMKNLRSGEIHIKNALSPPVSVSIAGVSKQFEVSEFGVCLRCIDDEIHIGTSEYSF